MQNRFINKEYQRVIPRDLFNEAKLLKSLGQLCLMIHDGKAPDGLEFLNFHSDINPIVQTNCGYLIHSHIQFMYKGQTLIFGSLTNSKNNYTLFLLTDDEEIPVFNSDATFNFSFISYLLH